MFNFHKIISWLPWIRERQRNKIILIVSGAALGLALLAVIFYFNVYPYRDSLIKYAPADSAAYVHLRLIKADYGRLNLEAFYRQLDQWFGWRPEQLQNDILPLANRELALAVIPWQAANGEPVLGRAIFFNFNRRAEPLLGRLDLLELNYYFLAKDKLVIADSPETLDKIKSVAKTGNLAGQPMAKKGLDRLSGRSPVRGYLAVDILKNYLSRLPAINDLDLSRAYLAANFLLEKNNRQIYFSLKKSGADLTLAIIGSADNPFWQPALAKKNLIKYIPPETILVLSGVNWQNLIAGLTSGSIGSGADLSRLKADYEKLYRFDWQNDLAPLLAGPGELAIAPNNGKNNFILTVQSPPPAPAQIAKLQDIVKEYLARYLPTETVRILPDKSRVAELIADPTRFNWQTAELDGLKIDFISEPELNFEFVCAYRGDPPAGEAGRLILSDSLEQLKTFLRNQAEPDPDWLNYNRLIGAPFLIKGGESALIKLSAIKLGPIAEDLLADFDYVAVFSTRGGLQARIY